MDNLIGKQAKTEFGVGTLQRYFDSLKCWHITYPDGSMGWVTKAQFELV